MGICLLISLPWLTSSKCRECSQRKISADSRVISSRTCAVLHCCRHWSCKSDYFARSHTMYALATTTVPTSVGNEQPRVMTFPRHDLICLDVTNSSISDAIILPRSSPSPSLSFIESPAHLSVRSFVVSEPWDVGTHLVTLFAAWTIPCCATTSCGCYMWSR